MEVIDIINNSSNGEIIGFIGNINFELLNNYNIFHNFNSTEKLVNELLSIENKDKLSKALQMVELNINDLDNNETLAFKNKISLVLALLSSNDLLILNDIHKGLTDREQKNIKRIIKKLAEYNKRIIVITNDITFLFGLTKIVYVINNNQVIKECNPVNWFDNDMYDLISKPDIINFIMYCRGKNIKIEDALETKELLKAIYRSVNK